MHKALCGYEQTPIIFGGNNMLVNATEMLIKARDGHYGVPQFNINNLE